MTLTLFPADLHGKFFPPPSKSQSHRLIIGAALADGESQLSQVADSQDIRATCSCIETIGAQIQSDQDGNLRICGIHGTDSSHHHIFHCGESGSTLRFFIPISLAVSGGGVFIGHGRLLQRPLEPYQILFRQRGIVFEQASEHIRVTGTLKHGTYALPGNVSSQFITGLLYALPLLEGDSHIILITPLESKGYVDMTIQVLEKFGISVQPIESGFHVFGGQQYQPVHMSVERDYSQAAFFYAANGIGHQIEISGLDTHSLQGDRCILDYYQRLVQAGDVTLDVSQCPDLVPALAVHAALREGQITVIANAARLRDKESDRLSAITHELNQLGAQITESPDHLTIHGVKQLHGGSVEARQDHRIAMMLAIAATRSTGPVQLSGAESVRKSYPTFWSDYAALGGLLTQS